MIFFRVFAFFSCLSFFQAFAGDTVLEKTIGDLIVESEAKDNAQDVGVGIAIIKDGKVILERGYGLADRKTKRLTTAKTLFEIGSTSKAFTAASLALLHSEKKLDLEKPIKSYLPDLKFLDANVEKNLTALDILSHRTGMPRHDLVWYLTPFDRAELVKRMGHLAFNPKPEMEFRKAFQYNNLMYMLAGHLLEKTQKQSWDNFVTEKFFNPLGMTSTNTSVTQMAKVEDHAVGYSKDTPMPLKNTDAIAPAGAINSSAHDMAKWVLYLLQKDEALDILYKPQIAISEKDNIHYGLGWILNEVGGKKMIWHNGNIDGYSAHVSFLPEEKMGIVLLTNQNGAGDLSTQLPRRIYAELLKNANMRIPDVFKSYDRYVEVEQSACPVDSRYEDYRNAGYGDMRLCEDKGTWYLHYYENLWELEKKDEANWLIHVELMGGALKTTVPLKFKVDGGERVSFSVTLEAEVAPIEFLVRRE